MAKTMLTAQEAADYLKISYYTILQKSKAGQIPCCRIGSRVLFSQEGLTAWVDEMEAASVRSQEEAQGYGKLRKIHG